MMQNLGVQRMLPLSLDSGINSMDVLFHLKSLMWVMFFVITLTVGPRVGSTGVVRRIFQCCLMIRNMLFGGILSLLSCVGSNLGQIQRVIAIISQLELLAGLFVQKACFHVPIPSCRWLAHAILLKGSCL